MYVYVTKIFAFSCKKFTDKLAFKLEYKSYSFIYEVYFIFRVFCKSFMHNNNILGTSAQVRIPFKSLNICEKIMRSWVFIQ